MKRAMMIMFFSVLCGTNVSAQDDKISADLAASRNGYEKAVEAAQRDLQAAIDVRIKEAAERGDFEGVQALRTDKQNFEKYGRLPAAAPMKAPSIIYQEAIKDATRRMELKFDQVVKAYTRDMNFTRAEAVKKEMDDFLRTATQPRPMLKEEPIEGPPGSPFVYTFYHWKENDQPVRMIHKDEGFCYLTSIRGAFNGGGEGAHVYIDDDGYWYLRGESARGILRLSAVAVKFRPPVKSEAADPAKPAKTQAAPEKKRVETPAAP